MMSHHTNTEPDRNPLPDAASKTGRPVNWDRDEMRPDPGTNPDPRPSDDEPEAPTWSENQMTRDRPDGTREAGLSDEELEASRGGLSGGGANPGGGERWADRDRKR
jgi:hypothetical protein